MAQSTPATYVDALAVTARAAEVTAASFDNGMNAASCQAGIGIAIGQPDLYQNPDYLPTVGDPASWTLLDQAEAVRVPQDSQSLGGAGFVDRTVATGNWNGSGGLEGAGVQPVLTGTNADNNADGSVDPSTNGILTVDGSANLNTLALGWAKV